MEQDSVATHKYVEQYERIQRWYTRFCRLNEGRKHEVLSENYVDEIYAFFQNCYHLKDWIKNDETLANTARDAVEPFINANRSMRLCADICNALKHLNLLSSRSGENPEFGAKHYALHPGGTETMISLKYEVNTDGGPKDAFELATECLQAWDVFLPTYGLK